MNEEMVLVAGTTADYIGHLAGVLPGRLVFLTDPSQHPGDIEGGLHLVTPLSDPAGAAEALDGFLNERNVRIGGVACFDCESLLLASNLAGRLGLPFPSGEAVRLSRDKHRSKKAWSGSHVPCPKSAMASGEDGALSFFASIGGPVVLKPPALSGSELTYICRSRGEVSRAFHSVSDGLRSAMADPLRNRDGLTAPEVLCEEFIDGDEYSCDFVDEGGGPRIIRVARKHPAPSGPAGTTMAYELPAVDLPVEAERLSGLLERASRSLGLERCMAMADFIVRGETPFFLEITPRPGGDCLPRLILASSGMDILKEHISFSRGRGVGVPGPGAWRRLVGLRVHAERAGRLEAVRLDREAAGLEIVEESWIRARGHRIVLPPADNESRLIGHVIFVPDGSRPVEEQVMQVREAVELDIEEERS